MIPILRDALKEYDDLPESIKAMYTETEWLWLGEERHKIVELETQPDRDYEE